METEGKEEQVGRLVLTIKKDEAEQTDLDHRARETMGAITEVVTELLRPREVNLAQTGIEARLKTWPSKEDILDIVMRRLELKKRLKTAREEMSRMGLTRSDEV